MNTDDKQKQATDAYNAKWDAMVRKGDEAMEIVKSHERRGIPLDPSAYSADLRLDIHAAALRLSRNRNWDAGRLIDDYGDEDGNPTRERKAPIGTEM